MASDASSDCDALVRQRGDIDLARVGDRSQPRKLAQFVDGREMLLHAAAIAILVRRAQIGDDVALTQLLRKLAALIECGGQREEFRGFRVLQLFEWNSANRIEIRTCFARSRTFGDGGRRHHGKRNEPKISRRCAHTLPHTHALARCHQGSRYRSAKRSGSPCHQPCQAAARSPAEEIPQSVPLLDMLAPQSIANGHNACGETARRVDCRREVAGLSQPSVGAAFNLMPPLATDAPCTISSAIGNAQSNPQLAEQSETDAF